MAEFSKSSRDQLTTCDSQLQELFYAVVKEYDCTVIEGHRSYQRQTALFAAGDSRVRAGKHNEYPSAAVDVAPYVDGGIPWPSKPIAQDVYGVSEYVKRVAQFYHFAGFVEAKAKAMSIRIRWGGDWDRDHYFSDQSFDDLVHFELI